MNLSHTFGLTLSLLLSRTLGREAAFATDSQPMSVELRRMDWGSGNERECRNFL